MNRIALALCALLLNAHALHAAPFVYIADTNSFAVSVIDVATNTATSIPITTTLPLDGIAISPDGTTVYVPCYDGTTGSLQRIDTATNTLLSPITGFPTTVQPFDIAITPDGKFAYVSSQAPSPGTVYVVDLTTNAITPVTGGGVFQSPSQIVIASDPSGLTAYVFDPAATSVFPIDLNTNTVQAAVTMLTAPAGLAVSPDGAYLYVSDHTTPHIRQYKITGAFRLAPDLVQSFTSSDISSFIPSALVISPNGNTLYVSSTGGEAAIGAFSISNPAATPMELTPLNLNALSLPPPYAMAITPDNQTLYGTLITNAVTLVVNITNLAPMFTTQVSVGSGPAGLAITPMNLLPPASVSGCKTQNVFLLQTDYINNITWTAPASGTTASYNIYRDAALTQFVATVPASGTLQYYDHDRQPNVIYSYYITSVDSSGNQSTAASVTVTNPC